MTSVRIAIATSQAPSHALETIAHQLEAAGADRVGPDDQPASALVEMSPHAAQLLKDFSRNRVRPVLWLERTHLEPKGWGRLWAPLRVRAAARWAGAIVSPDADVPERCRAQLGLKGVQSLGRGDALDLELLPWGPSEAARQEVGLAPLPHLAWVGPLGAKARMDLLGMAHRRLAGVGLLVVGTGVQDNRVAAMSATTRPSSPVLHVPTDDVRARRIALQAARMAVALDPEGVEEPVRLALALGRRVVVLRGPDAPALSALGSAYPNEEALLWLDMASSAEDLDELLRRGLDLPPLPAAAVEAARAELARPVAVHRLWAVLEACASSS